MATPYLLSHVFNLLLSVIVLMHYLQYNDSTSHKAHTHLQCMNSTYNVWGVNSQQGLSLRTCQPWPGDHALVPVARPVCWGDPGSGPTPPGCQLDCPHQTLPLLSATTAELSPWLASLLLLGGPDLAGG